jgi:nicotinamidase-related amidase
MKRTLFALLGLSVWSQALVVLPAPAVGAEFSLKLRRVVEEPAGSGNLKRAYEQQSWNPAQTAVIICDTWDLHHCQNAVRRLEEFAPRINELAKRARAEGAVIIHAPSDCMPAYAGHPARIRAEQAPRAANLPADIANWCSRIPAEEQAVYPIDQSDGGEDDDPKEHAEWVEKLKAQGRNPGTPWKTQSALIEIDGEKDYISDKGDEVWNILQARGIQRVIMTGVHTNMCVLGRPFGLRQLVRNGIAAVLVRDLTDCMYNPARWPYVDHFTGNDLVISHIERFVAPTISSDQILGGRPLRSGFDKRPHSHVLAVTRPRTDKAGLEKQWNFTRLPADWTKISAGIITDQAGPAWIRTAIKIPAAWGTEGIRVVIPAATAATKAWLNGTAIELQPGAEGTSEGVLPPAAVVLDDANLLVIRREHAAGDGGWPAAVVVRAKETSFELKGGWQFRLGDDAAWSNIPLPARFGIGPDLVFQP